MRRGFTLIEILVAVTIVAVLTTIGVVSYSRLNARSRDAKRVSDLEQVRSALEMYRTDESVYPGTPGTGFHTLSDIASQLGPYLPSIPPDPKGGSYYYNLLTSYTYCLCGQLEQVGASKNDCGITLPTSCSTDATAKLYEYSVKNP